MLERNYQTNATEMADESPLLSVIVTTKNEEKNIGRCLQSIVSQDYSNFEVIVVDNYSEDSTKSIAQKYTDNVFSLGPERSAQRNFGMITKARGDFVIYVDADMIVTPGLLSLVVLAMTEKKFDGLYIPEKVLGRSYICRVRDFERGFYDNTVIDAVRVIRRCTFIKCGGFDSALFAEGSGEDWDLDKKIRENGTVGSLSSSGNVYKSGENHGDKRWHLEEFIKRHYRNYDRAYAGIYHNESDIEISKYLKKKIYYAKGFKGYVNRWGADDPDIQRQLGFLYRFLIVFLEHGKWKKLIGNPTLAFGMYGLRFLVGFAYFWHRLSDKISLKR